MPMLPPISQRCSGLRLFLMTVAGRAYPRVVGLSREKSWIIFDVFLPMFSISAYVFVYRAIGAPEDYVGFVVLGGAMIAFWLNVLWGMASQLFWERETGNLPLFIIAPGSLMAILLGMAVGSLFSTTMRALFIIILGSILFNIHFTVHSFVQLFSVFTVSMVALYGMGMMTSSLYLLLGREAWHLSNLATEPVFFLSGFYFPIRSFPFWLAAGASIIPLTLGMDAMRQLVFASGPSLGFISVQLELGILIILSIVFLFSAKWLLIHMENLAKREGRLTETRG